MNCIEGFIMKIKTITRKMTIKMIDLGLPSGRLWADRNVGAEKPEDYGQYFMHGDTEGSGVVCTVL